MSNVWEMTWFDVVRMAENPISANSFEEISFSPVKETYEKYEGTPEVLRKGLINSFRAAERKISVRKWAEKEIGEIPSEMLEFQKGGNRWDTDYIKYEIEKEEDKEEEEEEEIELDQLEDEDEIEEK